MDNPPNGKIPYTYAQAGFSPFMRRSIDRSTTANMTASTLRQLASNFRQVNNQQVNFDQSQITGALGDKIRVGTILIDGVRGSFVFYEDKSNNTEVGIAGNLDG